MSDFIRLNGLNEMEEAHQIRSRLAALHEMERHLARTSEMLELIETCLSPPRKIAALH
jgi:hypothetical protein